MNTDTDDKMVIVAYGPYIPKENRKSQIENWLNSQNIIIDKLGIHPNYLSSSFETKPIGIIDGNIYRFKKYYNKIMYELTNNNINNIIMYAMSKQAGIVVNDWDYFAFFGNISTGGSILIIGIDLNIATKIGLKEVNLLIDWAFKDASQRISIDYGFSTIMPRNFLPGAYALGVPSSLAVRQLIYDANAWIIDGIYKPNKVLRSVFGYQILSTNHVDIILNNQSLGKWISSSTHCGNICYFSNNLFCWSFRGDPASIDYLYWNAPDVIRVYNELRKLKILHWQKFWESRGVSIEI